MKRPWSAGEIQAINSAIGLTLMGAIFVGAFSFMDKQWDQFTYACVALSVVGLVIFWFRRSLASTGQLPGYGTKRPNRERELQRKMRQSGRLRSHDQLDGIDVEEEG